MTVSLQRQDELAHGLLGSDYAGLTPIQRSVIDLIASETPSAVNPALRRDERTFAERLSDRVAAVGGSWSFIIAFGVILTVWIAWNQLTKGHPLAFDPYPYIFLNLVLSMVAAIQAPVIMMSQNRAAARDREAAEHDYTVNLRAELEIMHLHDKFDAVRQRELLQIVRRQNETLKVLKAQIARLEARS
jgi:uncharacterized membrane protein